MIDIGGGPTCGRERFIGLISSHCSGNGDVIAGVMQISLVQQVGHKGVMWRRVHA